MALPKGIPSRTREYLVTLADEVIGEGLDGAGGVASNLGLAVVADDDTLVGLASQYLDSGTTNTPEARQAQVARWRQDYGGTQGELRLWRHVGCAQCDGHGESSRGLGIRTARA